MITNRVSTVDASVVATDGRPHQRWAIVALVVLTVVIRLPSLLHPGPIDDEAVYSVVANEINHGGRAYVDAIERKPPLLFWIYADVFAVAGEYNWQALHVVATIWVLLTMAGLYAVGRNLFDARAGLLSALLYTIFLPWATYKNLAFNGEMLMNLPLVWAWWLVLRSPRSHGPVRFFGAGALVGAGFLLKQPAAIVAVPLALYPFLSGNRRDPRGRPTDSLRSAGLVAVGFCATLAGAAAVLRAQGILGEAYYWTIADHDVPYFFWRRAIEHTAGFAGACLPLVLGAGMSLRNRTAWTARRAEWQAVAGWLTVSAIGAAASGRFYPHYYIQLMPPLVLLAGPALAKAGRHGAPDTAWWLRPRVGGIWLAVTIAAFSAAHWAGLARRRTPTETGQFLRDHARAEDRLFVWGQSAQIYLEAHLRPASRYVTTFPLTGLIFGPAVAIDTSDRILPGAWDNLRSDLARHPPRFIVDTQAESAALYPLTRFPILSSIVATCYRPVRRAAEGVIYERLKRLDVMICDDTASDASLTPPPGPRSPAAFTRVTLHASD